MNKLTNALARAGLMLLAISPIVGGAQNGGAQNVESAFLRDYSKLQAAKDNPFDEMYVSPEGLKRAAQYTAVMIDQPELFIHPDSKYKGIKPDEMKVIADALREHVTKELKGGYEIVDQPGPNVLYVRMAVGDLMVEKKKRPILSYTPVGAVVHAAKKLATDVTSQVNLTNMKFEGEILDSVSQEQFAAATSSRGSLSVAGAAPAKAISWDELNDLFGIIGKRLRCRLDNARVDESQWQNCGAIGLAPAKQASD